MPEGPSGGWRGRTAGSAALEVGLPLGGSPLDVGLYRRRGFPGALDRVLLHRHEAGVAGLGDEGGPSVDRRAGPADVRHHPVVRAPRLWCQGAADVAALAVEEFYVRVLGHCGLLAGARVRAVAAGRHGGTHELDADGLGGLVVVVGLQVARPVVVDVAREDHGVGHIALQDKVRDAVSGAYVAVPGVHAEQLDAWDGYVGSRDRISNFILE